MRLHRIAVRNFRGVDSAEVVLVADGVTIIEGDNETGKSTLADAALLILDEPDSSQKKAIRDAQPVGRDVGPEASVELSTGPYRVTYRKRWLRKPMTELTVHEPRREHHTGRSAHDRMTQILDETLDRALWRALHVGQGVVPEATGFDVPSLGRALDLATGADAAGDREDALWDRITAERDQYWTATGQPKAARKDLHQQVLAATEAVRAVETRIGEVDGKAERMDRLVAQAAAFEDRVREVEAVDDALSGRVKAVAELRAAAAALAAEHKAARAGLERWTQLAETRVKLVQDVQARETLLATDQERATAAAAAAVDAARRQEEATAAAEAAGQALQVAEAHHALAIGDEDHRRREIEVEQIRERCIRVAAEQQSLEVAEKLLRAVQVDEAALATIEAAERELIRAEAAAGADAATVTVTGLGGGPIEVAGSQLDLAAGATEEVRLTSEVEVVVPGFVAVRVVPGVAEQQRAAAVDAARSQLDEACRAVGVADAREARTAIAARAEALRVQRDATERMRQDLRDLTLPALTRKAENLARQVEAYLVERPALPPLPEDHGAAQEVAAHAAASLRASKRDADRAGAALTAATQAAATAAMDQRALEERIELHQTALAELRTRLERDRTEIDDAAIHDGLGAARATEEQAAEALATAERRLAEADPTELETMVRAAKADVAAARTALDRNRREIDHLRGELDEAGEQGLAQQLHEAETTRQRLERERGALEARAEAAKLLYDVFAGRRSETRNRYAEPFREAIEQLGRRVFGPSLEVELGPDLRILRRTLDGTTVDVDQLSTGAREQLGLIARLACASIVAEDGGAPVVFDDALGWSDPGRLTQMGAAIAEAARHCQVIVLTCTPGRYRSVRGGTTVALRPPPMTLFDLDAG